LGTARIRQPVAAPRHGDNVGITLGVLVQSLAQRRDVDVQIVFRDHAPGPQPCNQLVLADYRASCRCKKPEDIECPPADLYGLAIVQQAPPPEIEPEPAEANLLRIIRKPHRLAYILRTLST